MLGGIRTWLRKTKTECAERQEKLEFTGQSRDSVDHQTWEGGTITASTGETGIGSQTK